MAFSSAKNTVFKVDNSSGTLTDISAYCESVDFPETVETLETTTFGDSAKEYIVGLKDSSFSVSAKFDPTLDAHINGVLGSATLLEFEYGPIGSTSGNPKYTGNLIITDYSMSGAVADLVTVSLECQVSGAVTRGTY